MTSKILKSIIGALALGLAAVSASAQTAPDRPANPLGQQLREIVAAHRDATKALMEQRKAALEAIRAAAPEDREALKAGLRDIMRAHQLNQRDLAKSIRDAIKAARDARRAAGSTTGG